MDKFDRIQQLHRILSERKTPIGKPQLAEKLECSEKTVQRALDNLRDYLNAPLEYNTEQKGWYYDKTADDLFELPGLWLTAQEIYSLSTMMNLIRNLDEGFLKEDIATLEKTLNKLLTSHGVQADQFWQTLHYIPRGKRELTSQDIPVFSEALLKKKQVKLTYVDYQQRKTQRTVSPIKLVHYQDNWYLDAWCHLRKDLRSFMLARIEKAKLCSADAIEVDPKQASDHFRKSYGIFAGKPKHTAKLMFYGHAATDAASKRWHTDQIAEWFGKQYQLTIPYNDDRELIRDILAYGDQVEVLAPSALKKRISNIAKRMVTNYEPNWGGGRF